MVNHGGEGIAAGAQGQPGSQEAEKPHCMCTQVVERKNRKWGPVIMSKPTYSGGRTFSSKLSN